MSLKLIFSDKKFRPLFWVQFLAAFNDNLLKNGMIILVEYQGLTLLGLEPPAIVALAGAIFILPFFGFSMLAGQVADRFDKARIVQLTKVWELLITLTCTFGFLQHNLWILLVGLFMMGCHSTFFGPIKYSALPELVPPQKLVSANAYVEAGTFIAILLGTIGGGVLISLASGEYWLSIAINLLAFAGLLISGRMTPMPSQSPKLPLRLKPFGMMSDTLKIMRKQAVVFHSVIGISWFWAFGAVILSVLPPYCKEFLHADEHVVTCFLAMFTVGIAIGSIICERVSKGEVNLGLVPIGAAGLSIFLFDLSWASVIPVEAASPLLNLHEFIATAHGPRLLFDFVMMSIFGGFFILPLYTVIQARSQRGERSRVIAGNNVVNSVFMVVGALSVMLAHQLRLTIPTVLMALAISNALATAMIFYFAPEFRQRFMAFARGKQKPSSST